MSEDLKQHWRDELELFYVPEDISVDWVQFDFEDGYDKYGRDGIIFTGLNGASEASPLKGYFDNSYACIRGALDSISFDWPEFVRGVDEIKINKLVSNIQEIAKLDAAEYVKVKVLNFDDIDTVKKVRDTCGPSTKIRIDCNGSFDADDALKVLDSLKACDLEFIEQPCSTNEENAALRKKTETLITLDESANSREDIDEIQTLEAADLIVVKVQTAGGIFSALDIVDQWGKDFVISSMMETKVGIDLGFALARSVPELKYACGLSESPINNIVREPLYS